MKEPCFANRSQRPGNARSWNFWSTDWRTAINGGQRSLRGPTPSGGPWAPELLEAAAVGMRGRNLCADGRRPRVEACGRPGREPRTSDAGESDRNPQDTERLRITTAAWRSRTSAARRAASSALDARAPAHVMVPGSPQTVLRCEAVRATANRCFTIAVLKL